MDAEEIRLEEDGSIVVPSRFLHVLGLKVGDKLIVRLDEDGLFLESRAWSLERAQRLMKTLYAPERDPVQELIDERRLEAQRELEEL